MEETKRSVVILIVDDDELVRMTLSVLVGSLGYHCLVAGDGVEALAVLRSTQVDLVLTDIVMPGMDGIEVARLAAARHPGLRIMFITGFAAVALAAGESAPPGAKVLSKPIHLREIVSEVERMMAAA